MLALIIILYYYLGSDPKSVTGLYNFESLWINCVTHSKKFGISGPHAHYLLNERVEPSDL